MMENLFRYFLHENKLNSGHQLNQSLQIRKANHAENLIMFAKRLAHQQKNRRLPTDFSKRRCFITFSASSSLPLITIIILVIVIFPLAHILLAYTIANQSNQLCVETYSPKSCLSKPITFHFINYSAAA